MKSILIFLFSFVAFAADDLQLTDAQNAGLGQNKKLSDVFTTKYVLIDFSQSSCGYCIDLSKGINQDSGKQAMFSGDKCKLVTVVPRGDLGRWKRAIGGGFVGDNSYELQIGMTTWARSFKFSLRGTPSTILVDRKGQMVTSAVGSEPANLEQYCN